MSRSNSVRGLKLSRFPRWAATALWLIVLADSAHGQTNQSLLKSNQLAYLREHYTKFEYKIPMRDGVKLFTAIYAPKDDSQLYPILLSRTPYSLKPYSDDVYPEPSGPMEHYATES